jgi:hypothetical protein
MREESFIFLCMFSLTIFLEEKEKGKKTWWGGDIVSRGTWEPQAPTNYVGLSRPSSSLAIEDSKGMLDSDTLFGMSLK